MTGSSLKGCTQRPSGDGIPLGRLAGRTSCKGSSSVIAAAVDERFDEQHARVIRLVHTPTGVASHLQVITAQTAALTNEADRGRAGTGPDTIHPRRHRGVFDYGRPVANGSAPPGQMLIERATAFGPAYGIEILGPSPLA